jgi:hypothetical protein
MSAASQIQVAATANDGAMKVVADGLGWPHDDRRTSKRMPYGCSGTVAAFLPPDIPPKEAFWMIRCRDLSRRGIAFYSPIKPSSPSLVVRLGSLDGADCLLACRVSHCADVGTQASPQFLVGCEFLERLGECLGGNAE